MPMWAFSMRPDRRNDRTQNNHCRIGLRPVVAFDGHRHERHIGAPHAYGGTEQTIAGSEQRRLFKLCSGPKSLNDVELPGAHSWEICSGTMLRNAMQ